MVEVYLLLALECLIPIALSVGIYLLQKFTAFGKIKKWIQQLIIGVVFGGVAIFATECGVDCGGAYANIRDAAPLCAGLLFGGPAGLIAGTIGGVERYLSTLIFNKGAFSVLACSVSTFFAGVYAFVLRKFMFDDKRPTWPFSIAIAVVMETIHLTVLLLTKSAETAKCIVLFKKLAIPMIVANVIALFGSSIAVGAIHVALKEDKSNNYQKISHKVQLWLLLVVFVSYLATTLFSSVTQTNSAFINTENLFVENIQDLNDTVLTASNERMTSNVKAIKSLWDSGERNWATLLNTSGQDKERATIDEINVIAAKDSEDGEIKNGAFLYTSEDSYRGLNMTTIGSDENNQARVFHSEMTSSESGIYIQPFQKQGKQGTMMKYAGIMLDDGSAYIQVGLSEYTFTNALSDRFLTATSFRHIGKFGYIVILDYNNGLVSDLPVLRNPENTSETFAAPTSPDARGLKVDELNKLEMKKRYVGTVFGQKAHYMFDDCETFYIIAVMPEYEVFETRDAQIYISSFMQIIVFAVLFAFIYFLLKILVVNNITKITGKLSTIISGDLNVVVDVKSSQEFASLSRDINYTVDTLKRLIAEAAARIDKELAFAKSIQLSALPSVWPAYPHEHSFDIFATMNTAKEVGGDFYDLFMIDLDHLAFLVADVSGKGVPAAMFMMESKTMIRNYAKTGLSVEQILTKANEGLCQGNDAGMFVTCWLGIMDKNTGKVEFANAGHNYPVIYRKNKGWEMVSQKKNLVLGGLDGINYAKQELSLEPGDKLYLYTDGVTEATRGDGALYGDDRLVSFLNTQKETSIQELLPNIKKDIDAFVEGADQFDDITMLVLDYKGNEK